MIISRASVASVLCLAGLASCAQAQVLALYNFDDPSFADISGNGRNPTLNSGVTFAASGYEGGSAFFNGVSSYLEIPLNINPSVVPQLTMGCWVRVDDDFNGPIRQFLSHDDGGFDRSLGIDFRGSATGYSAFTGTGVIGGTPVVANQWTFVAVVYDQTAGTVTLHVNGTSVSTNSTAGSGWSFTRIGTNPSFNEFYGGQIDNVFFIGRALTPGEITTIREGGINAIPTPGAGAMLLMGGLLGAKRRRR
ncbi:MAG: LamG domain-containing protein [Phycisphaerales bacterium]|nr:LamG domain-containing protein [Phycisphaerales bacterium]